MRQQVQGRLHCRFVAHKDRTRVELLDQQPPLRVVRGFALPDGGALIHLHNVSGGIVSGDRLDTVVDLEPAARGQITTTGATRLYRSRAESAPAQQEVKIHVGHGALLEYLPDALIPFAGARYRQSTHIELDEGAGLFAWEILAPGRRASGEIFAYDRLDLLTEVTACGMPIYIDRARLEPGLRPLESAARMGEYRHLVSLLICRVGLERSCWAELEITLSTMAERMATCNEMIWGASRLMEHGILVRGLSRTNRQLLPGLTEFWRVAKMALYQMEAIPPRKVV